MGTTTPTVTTFDVPQVLAALRLCVIERGRNYVYVNPSGLSGRSCFYVHPVAETEPARTHLVEAGALLTPGCLIGLAHFKLTGQLVPPTLENVAVSAWVHPHHATTLVPFAYTEDAVEVLAAAQNVQDEGGTWGDALGAAEDEAREISESHQSD